MDKRLPGQSVALTDADISSRRSVSRRSVLGALGLGLGAAAAAVVGSTAGTAQAPAGCSDTDGGRYEDAPGFGVRCRPRVLKPTGCTDSDNGPNEDAPGFGTRCWI
ncbi:MAG TPA: hypothetical protein VG758_07065 [Hyphomicrobiaceae bacterium]|jgi:hypothetical protein|nr:hypothetical protein [Hyphomicrobiaceae bacterium]